MQNRCGLEQTIKASWPGLDLHRGGLQPSNQRLKHPKLRRITAHSGSLSNETRNHQGSDPTDPASQDVFRQPNAHQSNQSGHAGEGNSWNRV